MSDTAVPTGIALGTDTTPVHNPYTGEVIGGHGLVQVGVVHDDDRGVAAQVHGELFHPGRAADGLAGGESAGEGHHAHVGGGHDRGADAGVAVDDGDGPDRLRQSRTRRGNWYCPSMPQPLKDATKDLLAKKIDKHTWIDRIRARANYVFMPKQRPDADGHRRVMCPAEANRAQCSLKPRTLGRGIHLPLVDPAPSGSSTPSARSPILP
ncbi:hypothetical protein QFZ43_001051 [Streptomyces afghaniensis]|nr:hypothetical protein [Streptomyces afghaniensis]